jgi:DNA-binding transcriptional LysR family regulator
MRQAERNLRTASELASRAHVQPIPTGDKDRSTSPAIFSLSPRNSTFEGSRQGWHRPAAAQPAEDLEAELGAALFHRLAHGAELTEAAKAFLAVKEMPLIAERATMPARRAARGETGSPGVGFTATPTLNAVVPSTIGAFRRAYPDIDLTLEEANTALLLAGLRAGTLDAAFLSPGAADTGELQMRRRSEQPMVVALPKRQPAAALESIDLARLKDDPFCCSRGKSLRRSTTPLSAPAEKPVSSLTPARSYRTWRRL